MNFNKERGTVLRITFDVVYPDGSLKTIAMSLADDEPWSNVGLIALNEDAVETFVKPALTSARSREAATEAITEYNTVQKGEDVKPALLLVHNDGDTTVKCGGHRGSGHAVATFM